MNITIVPEAEADLQDAVEYYDDISSDLGDRMERAYFDGLDRITEFPHIHPRRGDNVRQCILRGFPYALIYRVRGEEITVFAVAHLSREPGYWRGRLS